jgi:type III secretory pathway component EscS
MESGLVVVMEPRLVVVMVPGLVVVMESAVVGVMVVIDFSDSTMPPIANPQLYELAVLGWW